MIKSMPYPVPRILMSATFRRSDFDSVAKIFDMNKAAILQGPLARRKTKFDFFVEGDPAKSLVKAGHRHLSLHPENQQMWYCNSRTACEGPLLDKAQLLLDKHLPVRYGRSTAQSFTGGDGLKMKTVMDAFTRFGDLDGIATINEDGSVCPPKI